MRLGVGLGQHLDLGKAPELALVGEPLLGPRAAQDVERLREALLGLVHGHVEALELGRLVAAPDPDIDAAAGDVIERGPVLRNPYRVMKRQDHDRGVDANPGRQRDRLGREDRHRGTAISAE